MAVTSMQRCREVYKYYQPENFAASSRPDTPLEDDVLVSQTQEINFTTQQSFSDTALTAFCQIIASRFEAQRAIVSLSDHKYEYFLAESTSTFSLIDDDGAQNAWRSICGPKVCRTASLCEETLQMASTANQASVQAHLVPDTVLDERMCKLGSVAGEPHLRFYCGVPLTNSNGVNIGCVYVVDERPRAGASNVQVQFLGTMAATIMDHLENIRAKQDIVRVTRMSQALHAFVEGDGSMVGDWQRLKTYDVSADSGVKFRWESKHKGQKEALHDYASAPLSAGIDMRKRPLRSPVTSPLQNSGLDNEEHYGFHSPPASTCSTTSIPLFKASVYEKIDDILTGPNSKQGSVQFVDAFSTLLKSTFSRASNLIRQGMEVDGVVFLDLPRVSYPVPSTQSSGSEEGFSSGSDDEGIQKTRSGLQPQIVPLLKTSRSPLTGATTSAGLYNDKSNRNCDVLGFSTAESSSLEGQTMDGVTTFGNFHQKFLNRLVSRYPQGKLFVIDHENENYVTDASSKPAEHTLPNNMNDHRRKEEARSSTESSTLLAAFPGARQVLFVPLLDTTSGSFIGSFAWSTSATRIFSVENHLSYLVAFGHSILAEIMTLNTLSADRAKGDFISNVSHELRSPLHGILASIEFLADTSLDGFQRNLVKTVDVCGRTLLDTVEHILDFTKIKQYGQDNSQPMAVIPDLDISAVIEEVLGCVYAGFEYNGLSSEGLADTTQSQDSSAQIVEMTSSKSVGNSFASNGLPTVIFDVKYDANWKFPAVPGTWKRLAMNLFSNALKYTEHGWIKVKLDVQRQPKTNYDNSEHGSQAIVSLSISDSGRGITPEFMKDQLFTPFSQEDVTAPGTGLGLNVIKQIVDLSGGDIDISSELGVGTEVKLRLPLNDYVQENQAHNLPRPRELSSIEEVRRRVHGLTVRIDGLVPHKDDSIIATQLLVDLNTSIEKYLTEWFGLILLPKEGNTPADIIITDETVCTSPSPAQKRKLPPQTRCVVVLCNNRIKRNTDQSQLEGGQAIEFVSRPFGPHQLAKTILACLDAEIALSTKETQAAEAGSLDIEGSSSTCSIDVADLQDLMGAVTIVEVPQLVQKDNPIQISLGQNSNPSGKQNPPEAIRIQDGGISKSNISSTSRTVDVLSPALEVKSKRSPTMLLVEDNPVNMMLLSTYMRKNKWKFEKANNGLEALKAFEQRPEGFDVVFMDVSMPIMGGYDSTIAIRALEAERNETREEQHQALVIALTGFSSREDQEQAYKAGMDVFMTKPVKFKEVGRILKNWLEREGF
ncbi:hsp90-like protein [Phlyctema vagabunda]|uniref:histidine kinase n=1 Tax=Phlyctema vagabunda TaxID=108571 RepID=A0ABR4PCE5_9HELO